MPQQLGDVLHYFLPEIGSGSGAPGPARGPQRVAIPLGARDVVRAALVWNLAVELARQGARAAVMPPASDESASLWPEPGRGPLGVDLQPVPAKGFDELDRALGALSRAGASGPNGGNFVLVPVPPAWLGRSEADASTLLEWLLLLARPQERELLDAYAALKRVSRARPGARLGVSVCGAHNVAQAERTFSLLATTARRHLGCPLVSYGLLVDDLHLCRSIVTRRPIGVTHPRSPAARALADVAKLLLRDARESAHA